MSVILSGEALALVLTLAPAVDGNRLVYFGLASIMTQWIALLSLCLLYLGRDRLRALPPHYVAWIAVPVVMFAATAMSVAVHLAMPLFAIRPDQALLPGSLRTMGLFGVIGFFAALAFQNHWRSRQLAVRAKQAELDALRARVNPHFLFNALNTATALVHSRPQQAEQVLVDLSDLFRAALTRGGEHLLAEEVLLVKRYLEIEQLRLGSRLRVDWRLPASLPAVSVPTLALQSLVENAVQHGIEPLDAGGVLEIEVEPGEGHVLARIANPVPADADERRRAPRGHGVGLAAARTRIESMQPPGRLQVREGDGRHDVEAWFAVDGAPLRNAQNR